MFSSSYIVKVVFWHCLKRTSSKLFGLKQMLLGESGALPRIASISLSKEIIGISDNKLALLYKWQSPVPRCELQCEMLMKYFTIIYIVGVHATRRPSSHMLITLYVLTHHRLWELESNVISVSRFVTLPCLRGLIKVALNAALQYGQFINIQIRL